MTDIGMESISTINQPPTCGLFLDKECTSCCISLWEAMGIIIRWLRARTQYLHFYPQMTDMVNELYLLIQSPLFVLFREWQKKIWQLTFNVSLKLRLVILHITVTIQATSLLFIIYNSYQWTRRFNFPGYVFNSFSNLSESGIIISCMELWLCWSVQSPLLQINSYRTTCYNIIISIDLWILIVSDLDVLNAN